MSKNAIKEVASKFGGIINQNGPTILVILSIFGLGTTVVLAVQATPKAIRLLKEEEDWRLENEVDEDKLVLTPIDMIKTAWRPYVLPAIIGSATVGCIIASNTINLKRNSAITGAFALSEMAFKEYKVKVLEKIGEKGASGIRDEIAQEHVSKTKKDDSTVIITGNGETLCFDESSGRYFKSSVEKLRRAVNLINKRLMNEMWITLNEAYSIMDLDPTTTGREIGWDIGRDGMIDIDFSTCLSEGDIPCVSISFDIAPGPKPRGY